MDKSGGVKVESFGCRLNALEGDVVARAAQQAGLNNATIINGCAVTSEAMRQAGQAARKAKRADPDAKIIVTGCAAQTDAARFSAMPEVDLVLGNEEKLSPAAYGAQSDQVSDIMTLQRATRGPAPLCKCKPAVTIAALFALFLLDAAIRARCRLTRWSAAAAALSPMAIKRLS
jgi:hypothetical protein